MNTLKARANYCLLSEHPYFYQIFSDKLFDLNRKVGVSPIPTPAGQYVVKSNTEEPSRYRFVLSSVKRTGDFVTVDFGTSIWFDMFLELHNVSEDRDVRGFFKKFRSLDILSLPDRYDVFLTVFSAAYSNHHFDTSKAMDQMLNCNKTLFRYRDGLKAVFQFVSNPCEMTYKGLLGIFDDEDSIGLLVDIAERVGNRDFSDKFILENKHLLYNPNFLNNLTSFLKFLTFSEGYSQSFLSIRRMFVNR